MLGMFITPGTKLLVLNAARLFLLVFGCGVVATFTVRTFQCDDIAHGKISLQ